MEKTTTTAAAIDTSHITLEGCLAQFRSGIKTDTKQLILKLPAELNGLVEQVKQAHQDAYQIRRGQWTDGYGKLNKPEIIIRMLIEGLEALNNQLEEINSDPNNKANL